MNVNAHQNNWLSRGFWLCVAVLVFALPWHARAASSSKSSQTNTPSLSSALINDDVARWARINHFHNSILQGKAQDGFNAINQYAAQGTGLTSVLLSNLDAEFNLTTNMDSLGAKVAESKLSSALWTNSWFQLATNYYRDVGISFPAGSTNYLELCAQVHTGQIFLRLSLLKTLMQTFKALVIGQQIQARQTTNSLAALSKQLANINTTNNASTNELITLTGVENLVSSLIGASQDISALTTNADAQMSSLYLEAAQSEDPATLVELVPMVGAGLDTNSLVMLLDQTTIIRKWLIEAYKNTFCSPDADMKSQMEAQLTKDPLLQKFWHASWECISNLYDHPVVSTNDPCPRDLIPEVLQANQRGEFFRIGTKNNTTKWPPICYYLTTDEFNALTNGQAYHSFQANPEDPEQRAENERKIRAKEADIRMEIASNLVYESERKIEEQQQAGDAPISAADVRLPEVELTNNSDVENEILTVVKMGKTSKKKIKAGLIVEAKNDILGQLKSNAVVKSSHPELAEFSDQIAKQTEIEIQHRLNELQIEPLRMAFLDSSVKQATNIQTTKTDLPSLIQELSDLSAQIQDLSLSISTSVNDTLAAGQNLFNQMSSSGTNAAGAGLGLSNILFSTSIWGPGLSNMISGPLIGTNYVNAADQQQILKIFGDVIGDQEKQQSRLLTFIISVTTLRGDLRRENIRHYQALSVVVGKEVRRWSGLLWLHDKYSTAFVTNVIGGLAFGSNGVPNMPPDLAAAYTNANKVDLEFPMVSTNSWILPSIRALANCASYYHGDSPTNDPAGWITVSADQRVNQAVKLVQGYFLLDVFNRRYALENHSFLSKEMREHEIHVNGILDSAQESEINLILSDQLAYHSSGVTAQDIQTALGLVESGVLVWIGSKQ